MPASRHMATPLRTRRHWTTDRIISAGLAVTACAGIVGVIGVRSIEDSTAAQKAPATDVGASGAQAVSSAGLTEAQLDEYAAQLQAEATRLDAYRAKLAKLAPKPVAKPAPKPASKPASKPAPKPQSNTKSS